MRNPRGGSRNAGWYRRTTAPPGDAPRRRRPRVPRLQPRTELAVGWNNANRAQPGGAPHRRAATRRRGPCGAGANPKMWLRHLWPRAVRQHRRAAGSVAPHHRSPGRRSASPAATGAAATATDGTRSRMEQCQLGPTGRRSTPPCGDSSPRALWRRRQPEDVAAAPVAAGGAAAPPGGGECGAAPPLPRATLRVAGGHGCRGYSHGRNSQSDGTMPTRPNRAALHTAVRRLVAAGVVAPAPTRRCSCGTCGRGRCGSTARWRGVWRRTTAPPGDAPRRRRPRAPRLQPRTELAVGWNNANRAQPGGAPHRRAATRRRGPCGAGANPKM